MSDKRLKRSGNEEDDGSGSEDDGEEYDFIDATRNKNQSLTQRVLSLDLSQQSNATQVAIGSISGWTAGYVCGKVGKAVAAALGGSILLLHLGTRAGYVTVDWDRVNSDVTTAKEKVSNRLEKAKKDDEKNIEKVVQQGSRFLSKNIVAVGGFVGGFFLGMASG